MAAADWLLECYKEVFLCMSYFKSHLVLILTTSQVLFRNWKKNTMTNTLLLAALHYNCNCDREQKADDEGNPSIKVKFPKHEKEDSASTFQKESQHFVCSLYETELSLHKLIKVFILTWFYLNVKI